MSIRTQNSASDGVNTVGPDQDAVVGDSIDDSEDVQNWSLVSSRRAAAVLTATCYLGISYLMLYPIVVAPVVADDYANPFIQANDGGPTLADGIAFGWRGATEGASFRVIGALVGSFFSWLLLFVSATFDVGITTLYSGLKFAMIITCAAAVAWFWQCLTCRSARPTSFTRAMGFVSLALFGTLQIHAYWSNDPVANYPLVGFAATALGFGFLALVLRFIETPQAGRGVAAIVGAVVAVGYYELNVGAVMGAAILLGLFARRAQGEPARRVRILLGGAAIVMVPAMLVVLGRQVTGEQAESYGGTTVRIGVDGVETFAVGMVGSLPGAAWGLSVRTLGGTLGMVWISVAVVIIVVWSALGWAAAQRGGASKAGGARDLWLFVASVSAVVCYWSVATALQAATVKVQDETKGLGYVYTSYSVGAASVALGIAWGLRALHGERRAWGSVGPLVLTLAATFLLVQLTVNWRLSEQLSASLVPNRQLLDAFDDDAPIPERCQALQNWTAGAWPEYYEVGMVEGLDVAYRYYFGEDFCSGFVRPP